MNNLRPDEQATDAKIEQAQGRDRNIGRGLKTVGALGAAVVGGGIASKVMPFLNQYIPAELAMKGINKVSPRLGEFLQKGMSKGLNLKEGLEFIKNSFKPKQEPEKEERNIIQKYSPELFEFLNGHIQKGRSPLEAGALATLGDEGKKFSQIIKKIEKDHKTPWSGILKTIFGQEGERQSSLNKFNQKTKKPSVLDEERERFQRGYGQQMQEEQQQQQGSGQVKQQLMQAMQNLSQQLRQ